jgi:hypothetical protein
VVGPICLKAIEKTIENDRLLIPGIPFLHHFCYNCVIASGDWIRGDGLLMRRAHRKLLKRMRVVNYGKGSLERPDTGRE